MLKSNNSESLHYVNHWQGQKIRDNASLGSLSIVKLNSRIKALLQFTITKILTTYMAQFALFDILIVKQITRGFWHD